MERECIERSGDSIVIRLFSLSNYDFLTNLNVINFVDKIEKKRTHYRICNLIARVTSRIHVGKVSIKQKIIYIHVRTHRTQTNK